MFFFMDENADIVVRWRWYKNYDWTKYFFETSISNSSYLHGFIEKFASPEAFTIELCFEETIT